LYSAKKEENLDDGSYQLTIPGSYPAEILMQMLGHGSQVAVVEPDWFRSMLAKEVWRMGDLYCCSDAEFDSKLFRYSCDVSLK
jgi:predicted DNA-binding transcriptional regulator YafY